MGYVNLKIIFWKLFTIISIILLPVCYGITDPRDVNAINRLYSSLGFPVLPGWVPNGGDPCAEYWLGVQCVDTQITDIILKEKNLGGVLGDSLGDFASIIVIDLSNNHIGGVIPSNLPPTIQSFYLSSNQFTGILPESLSSLSQVNDLSVDNNQLTGVIPDVFQQLPQLINLNLSKNSFSGQLPNSMGSLSVLTTLHLQNNKLIGTLDVLQDLPLRDLNVENNLFSGPIPPKLLDIPNFRSEGNPFNTSVLPSPLVSPPLPSPSESPPSDLAPSYEALGPSSTRIPVEKSGNKPHSSKVMTWIIVSGAVAVVLLGLGICFLVYRCSKKTQPTKKIGRTVKTSFHDDPKEKPKLCASLPTVYSPKETGYKEPGLKPLITNKKGHQRSTSYLNPLAKDIGNDHEINIDTLVSPVSTSSPSPKVPNSVTSFTIAQLQQYTDSFCEDNLVGKGLVSSVYRAETPTGQILAVKKIDTSALKSNKSNFLELVCSISNLENANIVRLVGYCAEHEQQLLIYEYCKNGSLYEALHFDDEIHKSLSWNCRIRLALGAARALEYMHEACQPPIIHKNFKSGNILLDDELVVHVSDCGLAPLLPSSSLSQLSSSGYGAPELESGSYTSQSDVYSFGVVMLEILTGRKPYDRSRPRAEQFLVRWAVHQLHDMDLLAKMVDPSLKGTYSTKSLSRFADIISLCLQPEPEFRPPMSEIVQNLLHMI